MNGEQIYECAICGKVYDSITERCQCEQKCLKAMQADEKKKANAACIIGSVNKLNSLLDDTLETVDILKELLQSYQNLYHISFVSENEENRNLIDSVEQKLEKMKSYLNGQSIKYAPMEETKVLDELPKRAFRRVRIRYK